VSSLKDKVVLITGGTSGIGRAAAVGFGKHGAKVIVSGRREAEGAETVKQVQAAGGVAQFVKSDVAKRADVFSLVEGVVKKYGRLDVAFNNAGVEASAAAFHEATDADFDLVFNVNVKGLWWSMQAEIKQMLAQGGGSIINTSSIAGLIGFPDYATYTAAKHAVIGLTRTAALEFAKKNIRVNAVAPGAIQTEMIERFAPDKGTQDYLASMHPIGRIGKVQEVSDAVVWLSSDEASFITGQTLPIDGGFTAQ